MNIETAINEIENIPGVKTTRIWDKVAGYQRIYVHVPGVKTMYYDLRTKEVKLSGFDIDQFDAIEPITAAIKQICEEIE